MRPIVSVKHGVIELAGYGGLSHTGAYRPSETIGPQADDLTRRLNSNPIRPLRDDVFKHTTSSRERYPCVDGRRSGDNKLWGLFQLRKG